MNLKKSRPYLILLTIFCINVCVAQNVDSPWSSTEKASIFINYFIDAISRSPAFTPSQLDDMSDISDALITSMDKMTQNKKNSERKLQSLNLAFASSMAEIAVTDQEGQSIDVKTSAIIDALNEAFIRTTGTANNDFLKEIRQLLLLFKRVSMNNKEFGNTVSASSEASTGYMSSNPTAEVATSSGAESMSSYPIDYEGNGSGQSGYSSQQVFSSSSSTALGYDKNGNLPDTGFVGRGSEARQIQGGYGEQIAGTSSFSTVSAVEDYGPGQGQQLKSNEPSFASTSLVGSERYGPSSSAMAISIGYGQNEYVPGLSEYDTNSKEGEGQRENNRQQSRPGVSSVVAAGQSYTSEQGLIDSASKSSSTSPFSADSQRYGTDQSMYPGQQGYPSPPYAISTSFNYLQDGYRPGASVSDMTENKDFGGNGGQTGGSSAYAIMTANQNYKSIEGQKSYPSESFSSASFQGNATEQYGYYGNQEYSPSSIAVSLGYGQNGYNLISSGFGTGFGASQDQAEIGGQQEGSGSNVVATVGQAYEPVEREGGLSGSSSIGIAPSDFQRYGEEQSGYSDEQGYSSSISVSSSYGQNEYSPDTSITDFDLGQGQAIYDVPVSEQSKSYTAAQRQKQLVGIGSYSDTTAINQGYAPGKLSYSFQPGSPEVATTSMASAAGSRLSSVDSSSRVSSAVSSLVSDGPTNPVAIANAVSSVMSQVNDNNTALSECDILVQALLEITSALVHILDSATIGEVKYDAADETTQMLSQTLGQVFS